MTYETHSDESLMDLIAKGNHEAFSVLVRRHSPRYFACAYRMCGNVQDAEDIVQDSFVKLVSRPGLWNAGKSARFTTWFYRVVVNQAIDYKRNNKTGRFQPWIGGREEDVSDSRALPDAVLLSRETETQVEQAVQQLPDRQKAAINLFYFERLSVSQASEAMGVSLKAFESLLMRAKANLKKTLEGFEESGAREILKEVCNA